MADEARSRLGRGLAALIGDVGDGDAEIGQQKPTKAPIEFLRPNPRNPRQTFNEERSPRACGIRSASAELFSQFLFGRFRASSMFTRSSPANDGGVRRNGPDCTKLPSSLSRRMIANRSRSPLSRMFNAPISTPLEEAKGYERLTEEFGYSQQDMAKIIGKSRSHVANTCVCSKFPKRPKSYLVSGQISAGHARALLSVSHPEKMAQQIVEEGSYRSGRGASGAGRSGRGAKEDAGPRAEKDADTRALEKLLTRLARA